MVTEFCGFNKGVIGKKLPSDSTLNNMRKEELINLLRLAQHNYGNLVWFYNNAVKANMAQLNNNGWIPCSERLPEDDSNCIVTVELPSGAIVVGFGWFDRVGVCWYVGVQELRTTNALAWMPLPAPYRQKEGE